MFARVVEFTPKPEKRDEIIKMARQEMLPLLRKQPGFLDWLPLVPENANEKFMTIALWTGKTEAEKFAKEVFPRVEEMFQPFLETSSSYSVRTYTVETTLSEFLVDTLITAA
jgi:quinol monooxygenase YgiN